MYSHSEAQDFEKFDQLKPSGADYVAVHLLRKTRSLRQVQKQLGHASPATTANMYADVPFEDMQVGVEGLYEDP
jgi:integrase